MIEDPEKTGLENGSFEEFISQFKNPEKILSEIDLEIEKLKLEIDEKFKANNIDRNKFKELFLKLSEKKKRLIHYQKELKRFFNCDEVNQIKHHHKLCNENQEQIDQVVRLDSFFSHCTEIENLLKNSEEQLSNEDFYESHQSISKAYDLYEEINNEKVNLLPNLSSESRLRKDLDFVLKKLNSNISFEKEQFLYHLIQLFKKNISFHDEEEQEETGKFIKVFHFKFLNSMTLEKYESYIECILKEKNDFIMYFRNFLNNLNDFFVRPILENDEKAIIVDGEPKEIKKVKLVSIVQAASSSSSPLENLENFIKIIIDIFTLDRTIKYSFEFIKFIGELWSEQIFTYIINYYFERLLPKTEAQLESFLNLIKKGKDLEEKMKSSSSSLGIMIEDESKVLKDYSSNIQTHFFEKLCQDFIIRMKKILKEPKESFSSDDILKSLSLEHRSKFADCQISDYMVPIKDLFEEMSALLKGSSKNLNLLLIETINLVCELFISIAPYKMKELIETDCKENAIFHNNCLFFGHLIECLVLTHKPQMDSLFELVPCIRNVGSQILLNQMKYQEETLTLFIRNDLFKRSLEQIANEIPSTDLRITYQSHLEFRQCLNDCLKHLNLLHNSFVKTLSKRIENRIFSTLLCILLNELIESILSLDDISSLGSSHLYNEIEYFTKEIKLFFVDSEEVVFKWMKLNEINFLFKSSLLEILNRWADGKGILATYLKPDEVKHLIRALFQNNERRANVLARIK